MKNPLKPTVLFIDDEMETIEAFRDLYQNHFKLFTARSVEEGLEVLQKESIAIVVTDMKMPNQDGAEFLEIANQAHRKPIKIVLSAFVDEFFNDQFQTEYRPFACVRKPLTQHHKLFDVLQEAVKEYNFRYGDTWSTKIGFLNTMEVLQLLGISKPTLYKYLKSGMPSKRVGGRRFFDWKDVSSWMQNQSTP